MHILLDPGVPDLQNKGNIAMLQVAVKRFHQLWPAALIGVITRSPNLLRFYCPEAHPVSLEDTADWSKNQLNSILHSLPKPIWRLLFELREEAKYRKYVQAHRATMSSRLPTNEEPAKGAFEVREDEVAERENRTTNVELVCSADLVVASGGGIMCDHARESALRVFDTLEAAIQLGKPTAMVGQQMGPMRDAELLARARAVLPAVDLIAVRERQTALPLLRSLHVAMDRVVMTGDDAIEQAYSARTEKLGTGIGISVRVQAYTNIADNHLHNVKTVLHQAAAKYNAPLIPLPISESFHETDSYFIQLLMKGYNRIINSGWGRFADPLETIRKTARCRLVVTATFHAAVFALAQGIPVVALANSTMYEGKLLGLADEFGSGCEVILLDDKQLKEKLTNAIATAWQSAEQVRPQLLQAAARQIETGQAAYQRIFELVESKHNHPHLIG
jgi:colanic acid/amylovoran biosynthesis protein